MTTIFECEYQGRRWAGVGIPAPGEPLTLRAVQDGWYRKALFEGGSPAALAAALEAIHDTITVDPGSAGLRFLPPLLPPASGDSLVNGFMGTHRSKFDRPPAPDEPFARPNYYMKGPGSWLRVSDEDLVVPPRSLWLLEEPEVTLVWVNDDDGVPHYAGYTFGNDLNDIGLHRENPWAWTPYAKLCETSVAPHLFLEDPPETATGRVTIERDGATAWEGPFSCGADSIFQRIPDMVDHLLSYPFLRHPGTVNYMLLGADKASFHDGFRIEDGDRVVIDVTSHGVVLANPVRFGQEATDTSWSRIRRTVPM